MFVTTGSSHVSRHSFRVQEKSVERQQETPSEDWDRVELTSLSGPNDVGLGSCLIGGVFGAGMGAAVGGAVGGTVGFLLQAAGAPTDPGTLAGACAKLGGAAGGGLMVLGLAGNW